MLPVKAPKPTAVTPPPPIPSHGSWLKRAWSAVVRERRLPSVLRAGLDRFWILIGCRHKTIVAEGLQFRVRRLAADEHFVREVVIDEDYAPAGYEISQRDLVVDVGGNIGSFALYAAKKAPLGRVISIEPVEENYRLLVTNVALNRCHNIDTRRAALVAHHGPVRVYLNTYGTGGHSVLRDLIQQSERFEEVEGITLEDVFQEYRLPRCDFLKLDCEGAEYEILRGMSREISRQVDKIVIEYHAFSDRDKCEQSRELVERLLELGFHVDRYTDVTGTTWGTIYARRGVSG